VRIRVSGVNPTDWKARADGPGKKMPFPFVVPHQDGAGEIDAVGDGVDRPCPILIRHDLWKRKLFALVSSAARLPVGRVHTRDLHPDSDFTRFRLSDRPLDQLEHVPATRFRIDDRSHLTPLVVISTSVVRATRLAMTRVGNPGL